MVDFGDNIQFDVLKEIGNIGAGNATTALAELLNKKIDMSVPNVQIVDFKRLAVVLGGAENVVAGVLVGITGDLNAYMMFILEHDSAHLLVNLLMGRQLNDFSEFDEMDLSAITEIGNILISSYLSSISTLTGLTMKTSPPALALDMAGAVLSVPAIEFGKVGDTVLFIETNFNDDNKIVKGNYFLIPDSESYNTLLRALGVL